MGRPERPLDPTEGPLAAFAHELRLLRRAAGGPTYAAMSRRAHRSASVLAEAAGGRALPTLDTTLAYVAACGGDAAEWESHWRDLTAADGASAGDDVDPKVGAKRDEPDTQEPHPAPTARPPTALPPTALPPTALPPTALPPAPPAQVDPHPHWTADRIGRRRVCGPGRRAARPFLVVPGGAGVGGGTQRDSTRRHPDDHLAHRRRRDRHAHRQIHRTGANPGRYVWLTTRFEGGPVINPQGQCDSADGVTYVCAKAQFGDPDTAAGTKLRVTAVLVDEEGHLALKSLYDSGYNAATHPVRFFAESPPVIVHR